jgi:Domain of unknown function (DUF4157)
MVAADMSQKRLLKQHRGSVSYMSKRDQVRVASSSAREGSRKQATAKREMPVAQPNTAAIVQRTVSGAGMPSASEILQLQRSISNRAVGQLLARRRAAIQAKLTVGAADDPYEREADRVASQVMSMSVGTPSGVSRKEDDSQQTAQRKPAITPLVRRAAYPNRNTDQLGSFAAGQDVERQIAANHSGGSPLPAKLRSEFEPRFGADFSNVRVHTGAQSDSLNRSIGAQAFTHSNQIYMGAGKYNPSSISGKHLLAHELAHVVQQTGNIQRKTRDLTPPKDSGKGIVFTSTLKKINSLVADYNSQPQTQELKPLNKQKKILENLLTRIESWNEKHINGAEATPSTKGKKSDLDVLYNQAEAEFYAVNSEIEQEKSYQASSTGKTYTKNVGASFKDNWKAERGDILYGFAGPRQQYMTAARSVTSHNYEYTMDDYNNYYGIGTGDVFRAIMGEPDTGAKRANMAAELEKRYKSATTPMQKAYYENLMGGRFKPQSVLDRSKESLKQDAADWGAGQSGGADPNLISLQHVKAVRRACKAGIDLVTKLNGVIHFVLDGFGDINLAAKKQTTKGTYIPITYSELRYVYRNWDRLKGKVKFYVGLHEVPAPWIGRGNIDDSDGLLTGKLAWREYGQKLNKQGKE